MKIVNRTDHALVCHYEGRGKMDVPGSGLVEGGSPLIPGEVVNIPDDALVIEVITSPDRMKYVRNGYDIRTRKAVELTEEPK